MNSNDPRRTWNDILALMPLASRAEVRAAVHQHAQTLADDFYAAMLTDPDASRMLDHAIVNQRLHASMVRWLKALFDEKTALDDLMATQRQTGEVHARIGVPINLVAGGARVLKRAIARHLTSELRPGVSLAVAVQFVYELVDVAIDTMNTAATANATRMTRSDEAYRLFFLTQNLKAERERQKTQLLEWAHQILVRNYWDVNIAGDNALAAGNAAGGSQFELWLQHKASVLFENSPELPQIHTAIQCIEGQLLPSLSLARANRDDARSIVSAINLQIEAIKGLLTVMFDRVTELEDGRDGVTRLLNRRYFPSVVKREIAIAQDSRSGFALLMVDIDRFQAIGQALGIESADLVLAQVADVLSDSVRAGDFVFRVGDDQFLILLADATATTVMPIADGLRRRVAALAPRTPSGTSTALTISVGVAVFDGHPDYQRLLERAEAALREAKAAGRNSVALAEPTAGESQ